MDINGNDESAAGSPPEATKKRPAIPKSLSAAMEIREKSPCSPANDKERRTSSHSNNGGVDAEPEVSIEIVSVAAASDKSSAPPPPRPHPASSRGASDEEEAAKTPANGDAYEVIDDDDDDDEERALVVDEGDSPSDPPLKEAFKVPGEDHLKILLFRDSRSFYFFFLSEC